MILSGARGQACQASSAAPLNWNSPNRQLVETSVYGSIFPAVWSFQPTCRRRGLGTCLMSLFLNEEAAVAEILGLPDDIEQAGLIAVARTEGDDFRPAARRPHEEVLHHDRWRAGQMVELSDALRSPARQGRSRALPAPAWLHR